MMSIPPIPAFLALHNTHFFHTKNVFLSKIKNIKCYLQYTGYAEEEFLLTCLLCDKLPGPLRECLPRVVLHPSILPPNLFPSREEQPALCVFCNLSRSHSLFYNFLHAFGNALFDRSSCTGGGGEEAGRAGQ
jgi:hypothetical protein